MQLKIYFVLFISSTWLKPAQHKKLNI